MKNFILLIIILTLAKNAQADMRASMNYFSDQYKICILIDGIPPNHQDNFDLKRTNLEDDMNLFINHYNLKMDSKINNCYFLSNNHIKNNDVPVLSVEEILIRLSFLKKSSQKFVRKDMEQYSSKRIAGILVDSFYTNKNYKTNKTQIIHTFEMSESQKSLLKYLIDTNFINNQLLMNDTIRKIDVVNNQESYFKWFHIADGIPDVLGIEGKFANAKTLNQYGLSHGYIIGAGATYVNLKGSTIFTDYLEIGDKLSIELKQKLTLLSDTFIYTPPIIIKNKQTIEDICKYTSNNGLGFGLTAIKSINNKSISFSGLQYCPSKTIITSICNYYKFIIRNQENDIRILEYNLQNNINDITDVNSNIVQNFPIYYIQYFEELLKNQKDISSLKIELYKTYNLKLRNSIHEKMNTTKKILISEMSQEVKDLIINIFFYDKLLDAINSKNIKNYPLWINDINNMNSLELHFIKSGNITRLDIIDKLTNKKLYQIEGYIISQK